MAARSQLPRSTTTGYLPLPSRNDAAFPERPLLPHSRTTVVLPRSRIPTPSNVQSRLPTPLDPAGGVQQYHIGHSRRESFVLFQSTGIRPPSRIPTPVKQSSIGCTNTNPIGASKAFIGVEGESRPVRSKTESNLLASMARRPVARGGRESTFIEGFWPDSCTAPLIQSSAENNQFYSPYKNTDNRENDISPTDSVDGGVRLADYAFSPRKYTPSKALENAMAASVSISPLRDQTNKPRTPSTIKRLENSTAAPSLPRLSSGHLIKSYQLLQPIQPADAPAGQLPQLLSTTELQTPRASIGNPNLLNRISHSRPIPPHTSQELNSPKELSPTPSAPAPSLASSKLMRQVTSFQPSSYWAGRFVAMRDRLLNESFDVDARPTSSSDILTTRPSGDGRSSSRSTLPSHATTELERCQRIFNILEADCVDYEAGRSLRIFRNAHAKQHSLRGLECDVPPEMPQLPSAKSLAVKSPTPGLELAKKATEESEVSTESMKSVPAGGAPRKTSFMDRLRMARGTRLPGRSRKSSGKAADEERKGLVSGDS